MTRKRILVVGAGLAGLPAALEIREKVGEQAEIVVLNPVEEFHFVPSNPWVGVGWRQPDQISLPLQEILSRQSIDFVCDVAVHIRPDAHLVETAGGQTLDYDFCVLTTGPELAFDAIDGLGPVKGFSQSICTTAHAVQCYQAYERFLDSPGPIVVGAVQGASCFGPAYEFAMILDHDLRKRGKRVEAPITFVTSEPYVGHLGLGGVGNSRGVLEDALRERDIRFIVNATVDSVTEGAVNITEHDARGQELDSIELPMHFSMLLPSFRGIPAMMEVEGLSNSKGFVLIDEYQRNPANPDIYAAGVCVAIPPIEQTPVPVGVPKTGFMIESMTGAIAENIRLAVENEPPGAQATWNALCLADMGNSGAAFLAIPQNPPRNVTWVRQGRWVRASKVLFEKYFLRKMRRGKAEPEFERMVMKMLGVRRLKEDAGLL